MRWKSKEVVGMGKGVSGEGVGLGMDVVGVGVSQHDCTTSAKTRSRWQPHTSKAHCIGVGMSKTLSGVGLAKV